MQCQLLVIKSFLSCAITTSPNGDDDDEIHCFKAGQQCEGGRLMLQQEMARFNEVIEGIEEDPFASDEDQEETESNEACIEDDLQPALKMTCSLKSRIVVLRMNAKHHLTKVSLTTIITINQYLI
uniref:Uncharacterized protein n=1 Tax=Amphimedon queenslandica TaxID=400682 RepID=A0A1X7UPW0_AMPQE